MIVVRDFSWNVFAMTGDVDAYLLYKQAGGGDANEALIDGDEPEEDETDLINF
jgi:hypothetical protein